MLNQRSRAGDGWRDPGEEVVLDLFGSGVANGPTIRTAGTRNGLKLVVGLTGGCSQRLRPLRSVPVIDDAVERTSLAIEVVAHRPAVRGARAGDREEVAGNGRCGHDRPGGGVPVLGQSYGLLLIVELLGTDRPTIRRRDTVDAPQK